jgi:hypothetical protein
MRKRPPFAVRLLARPVLRPRSGALSKEPPGLAAPGRHASATLALVVVAAAGACDPDPDSGPPQADTEHPVQSGTAGIIRAWPCDTRFEGTGFQRVMEVYATALTGGATLEQEVHDCQRLVRDDRTFGSLVGLFPLDAAMDTLPTGPAAVASVFNWGLIDGTLEGHQGLGIEGGMEWGCLWIDVPSERAAIARLPPSEPGCVFGGGTPPDSYPLQLVRHADSGTHPRTARWRWHQEASAHYIGLKCGDDFCSIFADTSLTPSATKVFGGRTVSAGEFDEQPLAVPSGNRLVAGPVAWIVPAPGLATITMDQFQTGFRFVASIELDGDSAEQDAVDHYVAKFNLAEAAHQPGLFAGQIHMHLATPAGLGPGWIEYGPGAAFRSSSSALLERRVALQEGTMHAAMGSTRWRWLEDDESSWVSCSAGCCTPMM